MQYIQTSLLSMTIGFAGIFVGSNISTISIYLFGIAIALVVSVRIHDSLSVSKRKPSTDVRFLAPSSLYLRVSRTRAARAPNNLASEDLDPLAPH